MRSDRSLEPELRARRRWRGSSLGRWNSSTSADVGVSFSGFERNHLFLNAAGRRFDDVSGISGLDTPADSRGFALLDYDRDGWQDIALVNTNAPLLNLYRNEIGAGAPPRSLAIRLVGGNHAGAPSDRFSNRDGVGARVTVAIPGQSLVRERHAGEGYAGQNSATLLVGLGDRPRAEAVSVRWPSGRTQRADDVAAGTLLTFFEDPRHSPDGSGATQEPWARASASRSAHADGRPDRTLLTLARNGKQNGATPVLRLYTTTATWCPACKRSLPQLRALRRSFGSETLGMFGVPIDPDDGPKKLASYVAEHRPPYQLLTDLPAGEIAELQDLVTRKLDAEVLPASIVADRDGHVIATLAGVPTVSQLRKWMIEVGGG